MLSKSFKVIRKSVYKNTSTNPLTHISFEILLLKVLAGATEVFSFFENLVFKILLIVITAFLYAWLRRKGDWTYLWIHLIIMVYTLSSIRIITTTYCKMHSLINKFQCIYFNFNPCHQKVNTYNFESYMAKRESPFISQK